MAMVYQGQGYDKTGAAFFNRSFSQPSLLRKPTRVAALDMGGSRTKSETNLSLKSSRAMPTKEISRMLLQKLKADRAATQKEEQESGKRPKSASVRETARAKARNKSEFQTRASHSRSEFLRANVINGEFTVSRPCTADADLSGLRLEDERLNPIHSSMHEAQICSRPTFGTANRFGVEYRTNHAPGPKYDFPEMVVGGPDGLARDTPTFVLGGAGSARDSFLQSRIKGGLLCHLTANIGSDVGPAGYYVRKAHEHNSQHQYPKYSWSVSRQERFQKERLGKPDRSPGPKYYTKVQPEPGVKIAPPETFVKLTGHIVQHDKTKKPPTKVEGEEGAAVVETKKPKKTSEEILKEGGFKPPSNFARRVHSKQFIGTKFNQVGQASPGPMYAVKGCGYEKKVKRSLIPKSKGWNPPIGPPR